MPEWLAPVLCAAVGLAAGVPLGMALLIWLAPSALTQRLSREERRQREIAARLVGEDPKNVPAAEERAVVHRPVIESSHSWSEGNNGDF